MTAYGIDLGTTFTSVATVLSGDGAPRTQVINVTDIDKDTLESVTYIEPRDGRLVVSVGAAARDNMRNVLADSGAGAAPSPTNAHFFEVTKREIGLEQTSSKRWPRVVGGRGFLPEHIASLVLRKVKQDVSRTQSSPVERVVITHPHYFKEPQKAATREAGRLAKLEVIETLNEPTAAALAYGVVNQGVEGLYLVFDLGGGTLDATLIEFAKGRIQVLRGGGSSQLGGFDWDKKLLQMFNERFQQKYNEFDLNGPHANPLTQFEWRQKAIELKLRLSRDTIGRVQLQSEFADGSLGNLKLDVTREQFEAETADLVKLCRKLADEVLEGKGGDGASVRWTDLREVLMVGGSTRLPSIRRMIRDALGRDPKTDGFDPNTLVAQGAAYYAARSEHDASLRSAVRQEHPGSASHAITAARAPSIPSLRDATARGIGIGIDRNGVYVVDPLVKKSTPTPHRRVQTYYTLEENQRAIHATLYEGESEDPENCAELGECILNDLPPGAAGQAVEVTFEIAASGRTTVFVKHLQSGRQVEQTIQRGSAARLTDGDAADWLWSEVDVT